MHFVPMSQTWLQPELELTGTHVRLVPLEMSHVPSLFQAGRHPEIWLFVPDRVRTPADMERYVKSALDARACGQSLPFAIADAATGAIIGSTRYYALSETNRNLEIGYSWLEPSRWRTACNTECKYLMLRHAFEALACLRVALRTDVRNLRSRNAMERFGAVQEGVLRKHMILPDGHVRDTVYYSVIDEAWPRVKEFFRKSLVRGAV